MIIFPAVSVLASKEKALDMLKIETEHLEKKLAITVAKTDEETEKLDSLKAEIDTFEEKTWLTMMNKLIY